MIVRNEFFGSLDALADSPAAIAHIHIVHEHLQVFTGLRRKVEFQTAVNRVAEFELARLCLGRLENNGVLEIAAMFHLETFGLFEGVSFVLKYAVSPNGYLDMLRQRIVERQGVFPLDSPVTVAVVIYRNVE